LRKFLGDIVDVVMLPTMVPQQEIPEDDVYDYNLWDLNRILVGMRRSLIDFPSILLPQQ